MKIKAEKSTFLKNPVDSILSHAGKIVDRIPDGFIALMSSHPVVACLMVQLGAVLAMCLIGAVDPSSKENKPQTAYWHLYNLSAAAQGLALGSAAVPIVTGGLNILQTAIKAMGEKG